MQTLNRIVYIVLPLLVGAMVAMDGDCVMAQGGVTVQLPVFRTTGVSTVVSVPDGGTLNLSGGGSSFGQSNRSGFGRFPSSNRSRGGSNSRRSLSANIIRLKELEQQIIADYKARRVQPGAVHLNGSHAVQTQADFITRNIGR